MVTWKPEPEQDRRVVEHICDRLHVYLQTSSDSPVGRMADAETCIEDLIAILHESPVADFGSVGDASVILRDARAGS